MMNDLKLNRNELNVLIYALNNMSLQEEIKFEKQGVSVSTTYNKIYSLWENLYNNKKTIDLVASDDQ
jgi:hypothetical protein